MSLQKEVAVGDSGSENDSITRQFQERLVWQDTAFFLDGKSSAEECQEIIKDIQNELKNEGLSKTVQARLLALQGRAWLLAGQKSQAEKLFSQAAAKYENDNEVIILKNRLGKIENFGALAQGGKPLLVLEEALSLYKKSSYAESAARFDSAFLLLPAFYKEAYMSIRDKAWEFRGMPGAPETNESGAIVGKASISVNELLTLARTETDLLDYYTGGKKVSASRMYSLANEAGLLSSVSGTAEENAASTPAATAGVTRNILARFLWNLRNSRGNGKNKDNATKYSERYRARANAKSPVADLPLSSPDFDAVLGCVENELMTLPDGRNFNGEKAVSGLESYEALKKE